MAGDRPRRSVASAAGATDEAAPAAAAAATPAAAARARQRSAAAAGRVSAVEAATTPEGAAEEAMGAVGRAAWEEVSLASVPEDQAEGLRVRVWSPARGRWVPGRIGGSAGEAQPRQQQGCGSEGGAMHVITYSDGSGEGVIDLDTDRVQMRHGHAPAAAAPAVAAAALQQQPVHASAPEARQAQGKASRIRKAQPKPTKPAMREAKKTAGATKGAARSLAAGTGVGNRRKTPAAPGAAAVAAASDKQPKAKRPRSRPSKRSKAAAAAAAEAERLAKDPAEAERLAKAAAELAAKYPPPVESDPAEKQVGAVLAMTLAGVPMPTLPPTMSKLAAHAIATMDQRTLQRRFRMIYGTPTASNNNVWLRRKLAEAVGLRPPPPALSKGRPTVHFVRERPALWLAVCLHMEHLLTDTDAAALKRCELDPPDLPVPRVAKPKAAKADGAKVAAARKRKRPTAAEKRIAKAAKLAADGGAGGAVAVAAAAAAADKLLARAQQGKLAGTAAKANRAAQRAAKERKAAAARQKACDKAWDAALAAPETPAESRILKRLAAESAVATDINTPGFRELTPEERADNDNVSVSLPRDRYVVSATERERPSMVRRPADQLYSADAELLGGSDDGTRAAYRAPAPTYDCDTDDEAWLSAEADSLCVGAKDTQDVAQTYETLIALFDMEADASKRSGVLTSGEDSDKGSEQGDAKDSKDNSIESLSGDDSANGESDNANTLRAPTSKKGRGAGMSTSSLCVEGAMAVAASAGVHAAVDFVRAVYERWQRRRSDGGMPLLPALRPGPLLPVAPGDRSGERVRAFSGQRPQLRASRMRKGSSTGALRSQSGADASVADLQKAGTAGTGRAGKRKRPAKATQSARQSKSAAALNELDAYVPLDVDRMDFTDSLVSADNEGMASLLSGDADGSPSEQPLAVAGANAGAGGGDEGLLLTVPVLDADMFDALDPSSGLQSPALTMCDMLIGDAAAATKATSMVASLSRGSGLPQAPETLLQAGVDMWG